MSNFEMVIGLEIHTELKTKTKMFSPALNTFGQKPNTVVNEIDLGYPGALPSVNKKGVELGIIMCHALNLKIDPLLRFDRKNYFYPDLSKGFQITQQYYPIGKKGSVDIQVNGQTKTIGITRMHLEEDTAKQIHKSDKTLIDYNRAGSPLAEIVTDPDLTSAAEAEAYLNTMREILLYSGVSDAKMEEGSLRCDVNISIKPIGTKTFGTKVEVKNLNSVSNVVKAIEFEYRRQEKLILMGEGVIQQTRRWDEKKQATVMMREKGDVADYRYIADADIAPIQLDWEWIKEVISSMPELASEKRKKYIRKGLNITQANIILANKDIADFFDDISTKSNHIISSYNWISGPLMAELNSKGVSLGETELTAQNMVKMVAMLESEKINSKQAKKIFAALLTENTDPEKLIKKLGLVQIDNPEILIPMIQEIISKNTKMLEQYDDRPERVEKMFMGLLMKQSRGQANPIVGMKVVKEEIQKHIK